MPPLDGNPNTYLRNGDGQDKEAFAPPAPTSTTEKNFIVKTHPQLQSLQGTVTFEGGEAGSIEVTSKVVHKVFPPRRIHSIIENADIEKNKYILATYFTDHKDKYLELLDYSRRSYGKPFDLTVSPEESLARAQDNDKSFITSLASYLFRRPQQDGKQQILDDASPINPDTLARYASIVAHFLQNKPLIVGEIKNLKRVIIGKPIQEDQEEDYSQEDVRYGEGKIGVAA